MQTLKYYANASIFNIVAIAIIQSPPKSLPWCLPLEGIYLSLRVLSHSAFVNISFAWILYIVIICVCSWHLLYLTIPWEYSYILLVLEPTSTVPCNLIDVVIPSNDVQHIVPGRLLYMSFYKPTGIFPPILMCWKSSTRSQHFIDIKYSGSHPCFCQNAGLTSAPVIFYFYMILYLKWIEAGSYASCTSALISGYPPMEVFQACCSLTHNHIISSIVFKGRPLFRKKHVVVKRTALNICWFGFTVSLISLLWGVLSEEIPFTN